jgi:hypothetical protein
MLPISTSTATDLSAKNDVLELLIVDKLRGVHGEQNVVLWGKCQMPQKESKPLRC